jgi:RNA polymerase sigma factor (TIGR02999 family)
MTDTAETMPMEGLVPDLYQSLRQLARRKMRSEPPGHTLQGTALVHEAYVRLFHNGSVRWKSPGHFYGAAAEAMRRILIERARRRDRLRHGGGLARIPFEVAESLAVHEAADYLALDQALDRLEALDARKAEIVKLRFIVGFGVAEIAGLLGVSPATVKADWAFARAWLLKAMSESRGI